MHQRRQGHRFSLLPGRPRRQRWVARLGRYLREEIVDHQLAHPTASRGIVLLPPLSSPVQVAITSSVTATLSALPFSWHRRKVMVTQPYSEPERPRQGVHHQLYPSATVAALLTFATEVAYSRAAFPVALPSPFYRPHELLDDLIAELLQRSSTEEPISELLNVPIMRDACLTQASVDKGPLDEAIVPCVLIRVLLSRKHVKVTPASIWRSRPIIVA